MESRAQLHAVVKGLSEIPQITMIRCGIWKPRTHPGGFEGHGEEALVWIDELKQHYPTLRFCCEVAQPAHVETVLRHAIDAVWIGARTTGNPFSVESLAQVLQGSGLPVLVKNAPTPDVEPWIGAIERLLSAGIKDVIAVHRGFTTYNHGNLRNTPLWEIPIELRRRMPDLPILCDPSHIAGRRDRVSLLASMATDMGFDGLMIETHPSPNEAWTDAAQQITPNELQQLLSHLLVRIDDAETAELLLHDHRSQIDEVDEQLLGLLQQRMHISREIAKTKTQHQISIVQIQRWEHLLTARMKSAQDMGLNAQFIKEIFEKIHAESIRVQTHENERAHSL